MFTHRLSSFTKIGVAGSLLLSTFCAYANVDMAPDIRDCSEEKEFVQPVTNGSCYGVIIGRGKELIKNRGDGENVVHRYPQGCGSAEPIDWKEANPEWKTKTCAPTYSCLENPAVDLANASYISVHEQPYENAPDVLAPIFPLDKDFLKVIIFADNNSVADTPDGCQYTCNDGYRISTGTCGATGGGSTSTCSTLLATITQGGSGYTTTPNVTLSSACPNTITATATLAGGIVTGVTFGGSGTCTSAPTLTIAPPTASSTFDSTAAQSNFDIVNAKLATYLNAPGNVNIAAGEFGPVATELQMTQDTRLDTATSFTQEEAWERVKTLLSIPSSTTVLWSKASTQYGNSGSVRFVYSYVIQQASGAQKQILFATEYLTDGHGWRKVYLIGKEYSLSSSTSSTSTTGSNVTTAAQSNFDIVNAKLATYLNAPGNVNIAAGEFGPVATELQMTQDTRLDTATSFTQEEAWERVKTLLSIPSSTTVLWSKASTQYGNSGSVRFVYSYVIQQASGAQKQILFATEYLPGYGWRKVYLIGKEYSLPTPAASSGTAGQATATVTGTSPNCSTGSTTTNSGFSCNGAPTLTISAPTGTLTGVAATLKLNAARTGVAVDTAGSGYTTSPAVTVVIPNNGTCTPYTPAVGTTVAAGLITAATFKVATPTVEVARGALQTNNLIFAVTNGGAGYTTANPPTVTIGGLTGTGCTGLTGTPQVNSRGELATISDLTIPSTCTGTPSVTISAPSALVAVTCPTNTTFTVANPTGTGTVVTATATSNAQGVITITNPGSGYVSNPTVTVSTTGLTCATQPVAVATIDITKKEVKTISFSATGGTAATAIANATGTTAVIPTNGGGAGYTSAPVVTVTQGAVGGCTTLPTATATISTAGVVTGVTLTGANQCTVAPILTIAAPGTACATGSTVTKCIANVCTGTKPTDAPFCTDDTKINGHEDVASVRRATVGSCTDPQKCEWYCPAEKPVYCELQNTCAKTLDECACPSGQQQCSDGTCAVSCNSCATSAPSQLKTGIDQPIIQCAPIDNVKTHFKYKITKTGGTSADTFTSDLYTVGTAVKHTDTLAVGTYTVTCFYGTSAGADFAGTCTKQMEVKASTDNTVQGCNRIYAYKGGSLSDDMWSSSTFDASFRCGSRLVATGATNPYRLVIGSQTPAFLQYDRDISDLFNGLAIGPVSTQTQNYTFSTSTDTYCAVKVGDGYSTNNSCKVRSCVGAECSTPQTFIIVPSSNEVCTDNTEFTYDIGCNEESNDYTTCVAWLYGNTATNRTIKVKVNGVDQDRLITCTSSTPPGALGPVTTCTMLLPTGGMPVTVFTGDTQTSFQTTLYTLSRDTQSPTGTLEYFTDYSAKTKLDPSQYELWQRQSITAEITCTDQPGKSDGKSCSCASSLKNDTNGIWSLGVRSTDISMGPDIMKYSRVLTNSTSVTPYAVTVHDTAGNIGPAYTPNIGVDTVPPKVTASISGTNVTLKISDPTEGGSGIWKATSSLPVGSGVNKNDRLLYKVVAKGVNPFGNHCLAIEGFMNSVDNTNYFRFGQGGSTLHPDVTVDIGNAAQNVLAYCVEDNAGNVTRGVYPSDAVGCFSSSNMNPVPTITTYKTPLQTAMTANNYGYTLSENATNATCFRGILSNNISTLITSQYNSSTAQTINWSSPATLKNTTTPNTNGYYYYNNIAGNTLSINNTPTGTGSKAVIVEGGNIQINANIDYSGTDKTLILIARKNTTTNTGGNIYINPSVTRIDAIIIADGAMMNATTTNTGTTSTTVTKNWIDHPTELSNRLIINGRLYSFNTRGGSLMSSGSDLVKITTNTGRIFNASTLVTNATPTVAGASDLERFRVILNDGNAFCTTQINYDTLVGSALPPLLQRPSGYTGGTCSF